jgi:hypothetical protein
MAVKTAQYAQPLTQDVSRGPSQSIWADAPVEDFIQNGPGGIGTVGTLFWDDFTGFPEFVAYKSGGQQLALGQWSTWAGNNSGLVIGSLADQTNLPQEGGVIGLYGGSTAIDISMLAGLAGFRLLSPASGYPFGQKLWYEARIAVNTVTSAYMDLFVGLMESGCAVSGGSGITSAASLVFSATNTLKTGTAGYGACLGFWKRATSNPADIAVAYNADNGTVQLPGTTSNLQKLLVNSGVAGYATGTGGTGGLTTMATTNNIPAANVWTKLGFVFDPTPSCPQMYATAAITTNQTVGSLYTARVRFFLNGQLLPWFLNSADVQAATFPASFMSPVIGYRSGGTGTGIAYVDWVRCAQLASY